MNKHVISEELDQLVQNFLENGGKITVGKTRKTPPKFMKSLHVAAKSATYARSYDKPAGLRQVDYEQAGQRACGYSTKYVFD